jgi:hypothetical protein
VTCGAPEAALSREAGARATGTRGAPGAALSREAGVGAVRTYGGPGAALPYCPDLELVRGGTRSSGYR